MRISNASKFAIRRPTWSVVLLFMAGLLSGDGPLAAQEPAEKPKPVECPTAAEFHSVRVIRAYRHVRPSLPAERASKAPPTSAQPPPADGDTVELGDELVVEVENLPLLVRKAECTNPHKKIVLSLDGRPLEKLAAFPPTDPAGNLLRFVLRRTDDSRETWTALLGRPSWDPQTVAVSVGLEDEHPVNSAATIRLNIIPHGWFAFWCALFVGLIAAFALLAAMTELLRDPTPAPATGRRPFSLARTQAAWWFFVVLAAYLFIGIITGDFSNTITGTVLVLLGISAATITGDTMIDAGKQAAAKAEGVSLTPASGSGWIWIDLLSDENGVSFHRFQMAAWTVVLGIVFAIQVFNELAMPQFSETLLALMGISAGTFVSIKATEKP